MTRGVGKSKPREKRRKREIKRERQERERKEGREREGEGNSGEASEGWRWLLEGHEGLNPPYCLPTIETGMTAPASS